MFLQICEGGRGGGSKLGHFPNHPDLPANLVQLVKYGWAGEEIPSNGTYQPPKLPPTQAQSNFAPQVFGNIELEKYIHSEM